MDNFEIKVENGELVVYAREGTPDTYTASEVADIIAQSVVESSEFVAKLKKLLGVFTAGMKQVNAMSKATFDLASEQGLRIVDETENSEDQAEDKA